MPHPRAIADIYARLKPLGFNAAFVRAVILPDWWEDAAAHVPANRLLAEMAVSRFLGISLQDLHDPSVQLSLASVVPVRLKTATRDTDPDSVRPSIQIALQLAELLAQSAGNIPHFAVLQSAIDLRTTLLRESGPVTLETLVRKCWSLGIIVAHLHRLPQTTGFRKFDGLVAFVGDRPCVLLAEKSDCPSKLAFHLAHELGHLMLGHVRPGSELLADENLERFVRDQDEQAADEFALELLTGTKNPEFQRQYGLDAVRLAKKAIDYGTKFNVEPGLVALIYGRSADRWPVAQLALKRLGLTSGAHSLIQAALIEHWSDGNLTDSQIRFVEQLTLSQREIA